MGNCNIPEIWTAGYVSFIRAYRPVESQFGARENYAHGAPFPLQTASPPNQTSFVVGGLSENTQFYTAGVSLGYRISARNKAMPAIRLGHNLPSWGLCWYVNWYTYIIYRATYVYNCTAVSCTVCGNQEVVGSYPIATLLGVVAQLAETTDDKGCWCWWVNW